MNFREAIFEIKSSKEKEMKLLQAQLDVTKMEVEILENIFNRDNKMMSDDEKREMLETLKSILD